MLLVINVEIVAQNAKPTNTLLDLVHASSCNIRAAVVRDMCGFSAMRTSFV